MRKRIMEAAAVCLFGILVAAPVFLDRAWLMNHGPAETQGGAESVFDGNAGDEVRGEASYGNVSDGNRLIWSEQVINGQNSCTITFERISAPYMETGSLAEMEDASGSLETLESPEAAESYEEPESLEMPEPLEGSESLKTPESSEAVTAGDVFADYRLSIRNEDGGLLSEQTVAHVPVCFEETYWIRDFSGDGFADIAFCMSCRIDEDDRHRDVRNTFFIWNTEMACFEESSLPLCSPSAWEPVGVPLWNEELSAVISFAGNDDMGGNPVLEMYSFLDGEWQKVRRLESIYSEDEYESLDRPKFMGQRRELFYTDGEVTGEIVLESNYDAGTVWCRRDSVWSRYYEGNVCLYPDFRHFTKTEQMMDGVLVEKYVRVEREPVITYENWSDMREEWDLPYASQETFETILSLYENVDMSGEYEQGDQERYAVYLDAFYKLIRQNALVTDRESGDTVALSELPFFERPLYPAEDGEDAYQPELYEYYFFDADGDGAPELTIYQRTAGFMIFDYDMRTDSYYIWYDAGACWYLLPGSNKILWTWDGGTYQAFYQLDEKGEETGETFCMSSYYNGEQALYLVMLPKSAEASGAGGAERADAAGEEPGINADTAGGEPGTNADIAGGRPADRSETEDGSQSGFEITEEMKAEGMYSIADEQWYFRVTGKQYEMITEQYWEAYESGYERMDREAYTYEELFGALEGKEESGGSGPYNGFRDGMSAGADGMEFFDAGSRIGARITARRVPWEEVLVHRDMAEKRDYLLFEDLDSGKQFYLPDRYGQILDIQVTESGICIRDRETQSGLKRNEAEQQGVLREHRIPGCFVFPLEDVIPVCGGFGGYSDTVFLEGKEEADALPQKVWQEVFDCQGRDFSVTIERISPIYHEGFSESAHGYMADYRLTVTDPDGVVLSAQRIAGYPAAYEQVHWLMDVSGDGFPDLVFCTSMIDGTYYHTAQTHFLIWDQEAQSYVVRPLPEPEPENAPRITGFVNWDAELSAVWTDLEEDEYGNEVYGMFACRDGGWELIRRLERVYSEKTDQWSDSPGPDAVTLYYRELIYEDGGEVSELLIECEDIWDRKQECLYPRYGWTRQEGEVGGIYIGYYYVRESSVDDAGD